MPDVGGRQKEIAEAEARLGRTLPPSVREWIAFAHDVRRDSRYHDVFCHQFIFDSVPGQPAVSILWDGLQGGDVLYGVRNADSHEADPPVFGYDRDANTGMFDLHLTGLTPAPLDDSVTTFAWETAIGALASHSFYFWNAIDQIDAFLTEARSFFPVLATWCGIEIYESRTLTFAVFRPPRWHGSRVLLLANPTPVADSLPDFLRVLIPPPNNDPIPF